MLIPRVRFGDLVTIFFGSYSRELIVHFFYVFFVPCGDLVVHSGFGGHSREVIVHFLVHVMFFGGT